MDDPGLTWPYWKFGLKKNDLFSTLHDQYNTFPSSIQDPEAFHHDVFEISNAASSQDEFYRLMADRKAQRLNELNNLLESASLEIIANPSLIGTAQWQHAVQLFRTRSLDSLVRYFASYIPESHPWHRGSGSDADGKDEHLFLGGVDDDDDKPVLTHEPLSITTTSTSIPVSHLPPSPRSMTMRSDSSAAPSECDDDYIIHTLTPPRTLSFSGSEADHLRSLKDSIPTLPDDYDDEDLSQSDDPESPATSVSDLEEIEASQEKDLLITEVLEEEIVHHEYLNITQLPVDSMDAEMPTPKPEAPSAAAMSFFDTRPSSLRCRSLSPSRSQPHHHLQHTYEHDCRKPQRALRRRDYSPDVGRRRRSPVEPGSRIQKPSPDTLRSRPRGRRPLDR